MKRIRRQSLILAVVNGFVFAVVFVLNCKFTQIYIGIGAELSTFTQILLSIPWFLWLFIGTFCAFALVIKDFYVDHETCRYIHIVNIVLLGFLLGFTLISLCSPTFRLQEQLAREHGGIANNFIRDNQILNTEDYQYLSENAFKTVLDAPLSTFSIDVDTASYSNIRRFLKQNTMPPKDAVRIEEMINYFSYDYPNPKNDAPISVTTEIAHCPWNGEHRLLRIGLKAKEIANDCRKSSNLVFLVDVSSSMDCDNKLPLLQDSLKMLVQNLGESDKVAIVVYAGAAGLVLPSTNCNHKQLIINSIEKLRAGGSTNGGEGIKLAYDIASKNIKDINRVILATDGDFNVGITGGGSLVRYIQEKAQSNIFLTVLGFGMGNYKDALLEQIANKGNGNYFYIDDTKEARKVLVEQKSSTLVTVAKDVKVQIEFNPMQVNSYRLIGYENRLLDNENFDDDAKDAGEMGSGHTVTAFYEIIPHKDDQRNTSSLKYQEKRPTSVAYNGEMMTLKLRYKKTSDSKSQQLTFAVTDDKQKNASDDFIFTCSVVCFGMLLRDSKYKEKITYDDVLQLAKKSKRKDHYRQEFIELVKKAKAIINSH